MGFSMCKATQSQIYCSWDSTSGLSSLVCWYCVKNASSKRSSAEGLSSGSQRRILRARQSSSSLSLPSKRFSRVSKVCSGMGVGAIQFPSIVSRTVTVGSSTHLQHPKIPSTSRSASETLPAVVPREIPSRQDVARRSNSHLSLPGTDDLPRTSPRSIQRYKRALKECSPRAKLSYHNTDRPNVDFGIPVHS